MPSEEYSKLCQYNITRYLATCYEEGKEPSMDIMSQVDFDEVSYKEVVYYTEKGERIPVNIHETLAQNCISNLPFEAYEKFVTADWINSTKDYDGNLVGYIIMRRNLPLLERLHTLGIQKALEDKDYEHNYTRKFIQNIINVTHSLKDHSSYNPIKDEEFSIGYLKLVKQCVCEQKFFHQFGFIGEEKKPLKYLRNPDWTKAAANAYINNNYRENEEKALNELFATLASQSKLNPIFQDALVHVLKRKSHNIKTILGLVPSSSTEGGKLQNILSVAFSGNSLSVAKTLVESFGLTQKECLNAYEENVKEHIKRLGYYSEGALDTVLNSHFNSSYQLMKKSFFPDFETQYLPLFVLGKDDEFKNVLLKNKEDILNRNVTFQDNVTMNECIFLAKTVDLASEILASEGKRILFRDDRDSNGQKNLYIFIAEHIYKSEKELINSINYKSMSEEYWAKIDEKMIDFSSLLKIQQDGRTIPITRSDLDALFKTAKLNGELAVFPESNKKSSKLKI